MNEKRHKLGYISKSFKLDAKEKIFKASNGVEVGRLRKRTDKS